MIDPVEYIVSCNGAPLVTDGKDAHYLELEYKPGDKKNVRIELSNFINNAYKLKKERYKDLLEIAGYIFAADRKSFRGNNDAVEYHRWGARSFHFHFKVRDYDFWNEPEVKKLLSDALCFMTGDRNYKFTFYQAEKDFPENLFADENFELNPEPNLSFVLFSGGLDSLAGALERIENSNEKVCLVSHQSGQPGVTSTQNNLFEKLKNIYPNRFSHYKFHCCLSHMKSVDETQRTRAFLYTSIAFTLANTYGQNNIYVYENGMTTINYSKTQDMMNGRCSRTTHPKTLGLLERLFTKIAEEPFIIKHPFFFETKTDIIKKIKQFDKLELLKDSVTCSRTRKHPKQFTHCGSCSQCIDRIFAVFATDAEDYDYENYYFKFFKDDMTDEKIIKALIDYIRLGCEFAKTNLNFFYRNRATELIPVIDFIKGESEVEKLERIFNLCQRHAGQVKYAINRMNGQYNDAYQPYNPKSFYSIILADKLYQKNEADIAIKIENNKEMINKIFEEEKKDKITIETQVKEYINACRKLNIEEPTIEQLFDITKISKDLWLKILKKSTFWHLLKDELVHSINQAKKQEKKHFWINVKHNAENKYADITMNEYRRKEKLIDDLPLKERRRL